MIITDEHFQGAAILQDAAPDIIFAAEIALANRGIDDPFQVVAALLSAAWSQHKELAGPDNPVAFVNYVQGLLDTIKSAERPH